MDILLTALLGIAAFIMGGIPFSVIIGRWLLKRDITRYGDGNPGAMNVFKAGGQKTGFIAVLLDVAKGVPFVLLAHTLFSLPDFSIVLVATCAVLGHAFSPFLHWHGGKAIAVTFGVMLGLPDLSVLLTFIIFVLIGFFLIEVDAWKIIFGATGTLAYMVITRGSSWEAFLMLLLLAILAIKHFEALHTIPHFRGILFRGLQTIIHSALFRT
jgi:glycerol-3-phosphate acyltransferase PlsY